MTSFTDLMTGPASRRALAKRDIAAVYRVLRGPGVLRPVSIRDSLAPHQQVAAGRRDSTRQDVAREVAMLRHPA